MVHDLRRKKGWTQEKLGREAGYQSGAGVSISRLENGRLKPTPERFEGIAKALGLSSDALAELVEETSRKAESAISGGSVSTEQRAARIQRAVDGRKQLVTDLGQAFNDAHDRAKNDFLMRLVEIAARVDGAPLPDPTQLVGDDTTDGDEVEAEVVYGIEFTRFGVAQALAATAGGAAVAASAAYPTFTAAVAGSAASAIAAIPGPTSVAATNGFLAALRVGTPGERGSASAGRTAFLTGLAFSALGTTAILMMQQRNRQQRRELTAKLDETEAELAESQPNVEALRELMPEATEILEYIAVHAGHALNRWDALIGQGPCEWQSLSGAEQQRYQDFVEIAAAQLAVAAMDFENLTTERGGELKRATAVAREILSQARKTITSHV
ncbi:MAG TPA: helix-turn-helix transcriptional regulator [Acidimicrobiales bacterium]|nr:helix-turn-helix transcriptional regulator [Acidimicrobiales bacterium]